MARRGPNTPRGKAASSSNAVKHGLRSGAPVIPELESFDDWEDFRDGIIASYEPEGRLETELAQRIASLLWRMKRAVNYETEMIAHNLDDIPDDLAESAAFAEQFPRVHARGGVTMDKVDVMVSARMLPSGGAMEKVMRYESHLHRHWLQTHHELEAIQARRKGERASPLTRIDVAGPPLS